jgi:hypothetical protein
VSATTVKLLQAASEFVGCDAELAGRLGIAEAALARYMSDSRELPDALLLRVVDIIIEHRQGLPAAPQTPQNRRRGSGATPEAG